LQKYCHFCSGDTTVRIWDLNTETPQFTLSGHKNWVLCIAWSPDGKVLASGSMDKTVSTTEITMNASKKLKHDL